LSHALHCILTVNSDLVFLEEKFGSGVFLVAVTSWMVKFENFLCCSCTCCNLCPCSVG